MTTRRPVLPRLPLLLPLLVLVAMAAANSDDGLFRYCNDNNLEEAVYCFNWTMNTEEESFTVEIEADNRGWVGFGLTLTGGMSGSDIYMGFVDEESGEANVVDRHVLQGKHGPQNDSLQDAFNISGAILENGGSMLQKKNVTYIKFSRKIDTGDPDDHAIKTGFNTVIWSFHATTNDIEEKHTTRTPTAIQVDFYNGVVRLSSKILAHASLMFLAWPVLSATGVFSASGLQAWKYWFYVHVGIQSSAVLISSVAFALIVWEVGNAFNDIHQILGLAIVAGSVIQPMLGYLTNRRFKKNPDDTSLNIFPTETHRWFGRILAPAAACNVFFGLTLVGASLTLLILYSIWFAILVLVFVVVILRRYGVLSKTDPGEFKPLINDSD